MREQDSVSASVWQKWILDAIRKIRSQKQRPSVDRICHAVRQHHSYSNELITNYLERFVSEGSVLKVFNKGQSTYKDPGGLVRRQVSVSKKSDLSKIVIKAIKELNEKGGSTFKSIEKYIQQSHTLEIDSDVSDWSSVLRLSVKRVVEKGLVIQEGKLYRISSASAPDKSTSSSALNTKQNSVAKENSISAVEKNEKPVKSAKITSGLTTTPKKKAPRSCRKEKKEDSPKVSLCEYFSIVLYYLVLDNFLLLNLSEFPCAFLFQQVGFIVSVCFWFLFKMALIIMCVMNIFFFFLMMPN